LTGLAQLTKENHQDALAKKLDAQLKNYEAKFSPLLGKQQ